jgi:hypothetical protein
MSDYRWLRCEVRKGMLGQELAVAVDTTGGKASLFVAADKVSGVAGDRGLLKVEVLDGDANYRLIQLPSGSLEGSQVVKVASSELISSAT